MKTWGIVFLVLQFLDVLTTWLLFCRFNDSMIEVNPVARAALVYFGWPGMIFLKLFGILVVGFVWRKLDDHWRNRLLDLSNGVLLGVVVGNFLVLVQS